jgi:hypothetical protein
LCKHIIEEKTKVATGDTRKLRRRSKLLLDDLKERIVETERGSTRWQCAENSLWTRKDKRSDRDAKTLGRRSKLLLDYLKERKGYWKLKEEVLDRNVLRPGSGEAMDQS